MWALAQPAAMRSLMEKCYDFFEPTILAVKLDPLVGLLCLWKSWLSSCWLAMSWIQKDSSFIITFTQELLLSLLG